VEHYVEHAGFICGTLCGVWNYMPGCEYHARSYNVPQCFEAVPQMCSAPLCKMCGTSHVEHICSAYAYLRGVWNIVFHIKYLHVPHNITGMVEIAKSFPKPRSYFGTKEVSDAYKNLAVYF